MVANVPKRTLNTLMNAISSGVVPRRGLEYIAVGRKKETQTFVNDLEETAEGGGAFRFISGRFGNGKSFMTQMVRNYAMDKGFVVMDADLAINRRITGSKGEGVNTYRELVKNTAYRTRPEGGAIEPILQEWSEKLYEELGGRDAVDLEAIKHLVRKKTSGMSSMQYYRDFAAVLSQYVYGYLTDQEDDPSIRWLKGEYDLKSNVRKDMGVSTLIDDSDWYEVIKLWTELFVTLGYKGLVVFLDEAVVLYKLQNMVRRRS